MSVGRLHAFDVLPRIIFNETAAEREEGLKFADAFGVGVSLHFKLGKLLLSLALVAAVLQVPALILYAHRGDVLEEHRRQPLTQAQLWSREAARSAGFGGATLVKFSMAAVEKAEEPTVRSLEFSMVAAIASLATLSLLCGAAAARELVRRDVTAMKALAPRPEHYSLLLRDISPNATAAALLRDLRSELSLNNRIRIERVACHHALRPVLTKAVETMAAEASVKLWEQRAQRHRCLSGIAALQRSRFARLSTELTELAGAERPARAVAAFVVFDSPNSARDAAMILADRLSGLAPLPVATSYCEALLVTASSCCLAVDAHRRRGPSLQQNDTSDRVLRGRISSTDTESDSRSALGYARPSAAPAPPDIIWENLELSLASRVARRLLVRFVTLLVCGTAMVVVFLLRGAAIDDENYADDTASDDVHFSPDASDNASATIIFGLPASKAEQAFGSATSAALAPYLTRERSPRRHAMLLVGVVVLLNSILRFVVRRGSLFEAHLTRTTEQSAVLFSYFASTTLNTLACYALAAWRGATRLEPSGGRAVYWLWYADVGGYLVAMLLWESLAPPTGALLRALLRKGLGIRLDRRASDDKDRTTPYRSSRGSADNGCATELTPLFRRDVHAVSLNRGGSAAPVAGVTFGYVPAIFTGGSFWSSLSALYSPAQAPEQTDRRQKVCNGCTANKGPNGTICEAQRCVFRRLVAEPVKQYLEAPPWDATARIADVLRVFFVGAVFGAGQPLLPWLSFLCIASMLAHDKWALLRERRAPPRLGTHLATTAARIAPLAAPAHACLALWTWSDPDYTGAQPLISLLLGIDCLYNAPLKRGLASMIRGTLRLSCVISAATWPVFLVLVFALCSLTVMHLPCQPFSCHARRRQRRTRPFSNAESPWSLLGSIRTPHSPAAVVLNRLRQTSLSQHEEDDTETEDDGAREAAFSRSEPVEDSTRLVERTFPTWREAVRVFKRKGIPHLYDVYDDARPLERERHPLFFHHWPHLSSELAKNVLQGVFTPPMGLGGQSDSADVDSSFNLDDQGAIGDF